MSRDSAGLVAKKVLAILVADCGCSQPSSKSVLEIMNRDIRQSRAFSSRFPGRAVNTPKLSPPVSEDEFRMSSAHLFYDSPRDPIQDYETVVCGGPLCQDKN